MPNHYHLVCRTCEANVSAALAYLNGVYARWWNRRHGRCGHVTQGRFKAQLVQSDLYMRVVCRYVLDNPVRASLVRHPQDWKWSSARAAAGKVKGAPFLDPSVGSLLWRDSATMPHDPKDAEQRADLPAYSAVAVAVRSDERFVGNGTGLDVFQGLVQPGEVSRYSTPRLGRDPAHARGTVLLRGKHGRTNRQIVAAKEDWGFTRKEIAEFLGLHAETVTRTVREQRRRAADQGPGPAPDVRPLRTTKRWNVGPDPKETGGVDGTRTRDLRRDRPAF